MAHKYIGEYFHNSWCRHPRPNRPFGHCLIPAKCCPVTLNLAWCLVFKERDMLVGETIKVKVRVGILKGPRKRFLCSLVKARELPRGTHFPWSPHNVHRQTVQIVREKMRVDPTWAKTPVFHQTNTHI